MISFPKQWTGLEVDVWSLSNRTKRDECSYEKLWVTCVYGERLRMNPLNSDTWFARWRYIIPSIPESDRTQSTTTSLRAKFDRRPARPKEFLHSYQVQPTRVMKLLASRWPVKQHEWKPYWRPLCKASFPRNGRRWSVTTVSKFSQDSSNCDQTMVFVVRGITMSRNRIYLCFLAWTRKNILVG